MVFKQDTVYCFDWLV